MHRTPVEMADEIERDKKHITKLCEKLDAFAKDKAQSLIDYECDLAKAIVIHRSNKTPATIAKDLARRDASESHLKCELAEAMYKSLLVKIQAAMAILNGTQSQNKYLDVR
jgi:hypothetical protein